MLFDCHCQNFPLCNHNGSCVNSGTKLLYFTTNNSLKSAGDTIRSLCFISLQVFIMSAGLLDLWKNRQWNPPESKKMAMKKYEDGLSFLIAKDNNIHCLTTITILTTITNPITMYIFCYYRYYHNHYYFPGYHITTKGKKCSPRYAANVRWWPIRTVGFTVSIIYF